MDDDELVARMAAGDDTALARRGRFPATGACGGWLWGIARRQAALLLRRQGPPTAVLLEGLSLDDPIQASLTEPRPGAADHTVAAAAVADRQRRGPGGSRGHPGHW